jgi:hypothetical protein
MYTSIPWRKWIKYLFHVSSYVCTSTVELISHMNALAVLKFIQTYVCNMYKICLMHVSPIINTSLCIFKPYLWIFITYSWICDKFLHIFKTYFYILIRIWVFLSIFHLVFFVGCGVLYIQCFFSFRLLDSKYL